MSFQKNHAPNRFDHLVFSDPANQKILREYAQGIRTNHLILHGPYGSGKSTAAQIIGLELARAVGGNSFTIQLNGRSDNKRKNWENTFSNPHYSKFFGSPELLVIDEVDFYSKELQAALRQKLNFTSDTVVMTTNKILEVNPLLRSMCQVLHLTIPSGVDYTDRAHAILLYEGFHFTRDEVSEAMASFTGSFRDLQKFLENFALKNNNPANAASSSTATPRASGLTVTVTKTATSSSAKVTK